ncbi:MAG: 50S ribosomal protein L32 [Mycobacteriaceae bacterium]|nr:50S ribosomal protein L32 [Mycobacteriaceae bacterium]
MAVPKRRKSRSRTRHRRAQWKTTPPQLITVIVNGIEHRVPSRLATAVRRGLIEPTR